MIDRAVEMTPLSKLSSARVVFDDAVPRTVNQGRIGVNVGLIESICDRYGIRRVAVIGNHQGAVSCEAPTISEPSRGSFSFKLRPAKVDLYIVRYSNGSENVGKLLEFIVNVQEGLRIIAAQKFPRDIRDPQPWVELFDNMLRHNIHKLGSSMLSSWDIRGKLQAQQERIFYYKGQLVGIL